MERLSTKRKETNLNEVTLCGVLEKKFSYHHTSYGINFFRTILRVDRLSGTSDYIPVIAPENVVKKFLLSEFHPDFWVEVKGSLRTHDDYTSGRLSLMVFVYATSMQEVKNEDEKIFVNQVIYEGYICKEPKYRRTPLGKEITDFMIAVAAQRKYFHIPTITWGSLAHLTSYLTFKTNLHLEGRFLSREYFKRTSIEGPKEGEIKTTYEISVSKMEILD